MTEPKVAWDLAAELGEGPVWVERDRALWFVDIKKHQINRYDPASASKRSWQAPEQVGFILPAERGGFVAGLQSGLYHFDERSGEFALIVEVEPDKPDNRLNDGVVDPSGRLWFGTMDNKEREKSGAFYCFANGQLKPTGIDGIAITNGPAVSPDGRILYFVDTLKGTIEAADIGDDGSLEQSPSVRPHRSDRRPPRRPDDRQRRVRLDLALRGLGGAPLFAVGRAGRAGSLPGREHHQNRLRRRRSAARLRDDRAPASVTGGNREAAANRRLVRIPGRGARRAVHSRPTLISSPSRDKAGELVASYPPLSTLGRAQLGGEE